MLLKQKDASTIESSSKEPFKTTPSTEKKLLDLEQNDSVSIKHFKTKMIIIIDKKRQNEDVQPRQARINLFQIYEKIIKDSVFGSK